MMLQAALLMTLMLSFMPRAAESQTAPQAESFVRGIYSQYAAKPRRGPDFLGKQAAAVFSTDLIRLIRLDEKHTPRGDVGKMDYDPICVCQDFDGLQLREVRIVQDAPERATAFVTLFFAPPSDSSVVNLRLRLIWTGQGWRIEDIETKDTPSLKQYLR
jgi:hypothetical protein